jgi:hypothetical protein
VNQAVNLAGRRAQIIAAGGLAPGPGIDDRVPSAPPPLLEFIPLRTAGQQSAAGAGVGEWSGVAGSGAYGGGGGAGDDEGEQEAGESLEDMLTRRTKEFNISTRERPGDVGNWLRFVALQDEFLQVFVVFRV